MLETRCLVCGAMICEGGFMVAAVKGLETCSDECAEIYYTNGDENVTSHNKDCAVTQSEIASPKYDKSDFAQS